MANWKVNGLNIGERLYNYVRNKYEKRDVFFDTIGYNPTIGTIIFKPQIIWTDKQTQKKYFQEFYEYISIHNKEERTTLDLMKRKKDNIAIGQKLYDNVIRKIYNRDWDLFFADHNYKNININFKRPK